jgi:hypothetical protein
MFVEPEDRTVLMRYGSPSRVNEFWKYDLYVAGGGCRQGTFEEMPGEARPARGAAGLAAVRPIFHIDLRPKSSCNAL